MKYPIGIQSFKELRTRGYVYVDKTAVMYNLIDSYKYVFLGRPRRFGKSLLMSTIHAYFEGSKELFEGLAIEKLTDVWEEHPVLHFDLNVGNYQERGTEELYNILDYQLRQYEDLYGGVDSSLSVRMLNIIKRAREKTGKNVVVLIDEYDKPILSTIGTQFEEESRNILKSFYGCLKSSDEYIRFAMLTGVSKFGKLSVFSDLNNIKDVSLLPDYSAICGITQDEIIYTFSEPVAEFAVSMGVTVSELVELLRKKYDGYRFSSSMVKVFNPYSLINAFADKKLKDYWFESGTPTFLVRLLRESNYDLSKINGVDIDEGSLYKVDTITPIPMLYQAGYLTIKHYDPEWQMCKLGYPNQEVETAFINFLVPYYSNVAADNSVGELKRLVGEIRSGDVEAFLVRLQSIFSSIPYAQDNSSKVQEDQFRNLMYIIFRLLGIHMRVECPMSKGRTAAVVFTADQIYVMEFKIDSTPEKALEQIHEKGYATPFLADRRKVVLIGINYSTVERGITGWIVE